MRGVRSTPGFPRNCLTVVGLVSLGVAALLTDTVCTCLWECVTEVCVVLFISLPLLLSIHSTGSVSACCVQAWRAGQVELPAYTYRLSVCVSDVIARQDVKRTSRQLGGQESAWQRTIAREPNSWKSNWMLTSAQ